MAIGEDLPMAGARVFMHMLEGTLEIGGAYRALFLREERELTRDAVINWLARAPKPLWCSLSRENDRLLLDCSSDVARQPGGQTWSTIPIKDLEKLGTGHAVRILAGEEVEIETSLDVMSHVTGNYRFGGMYSCSGRRPSAKEAEQGVAWIMRIGPAEGTAFDVQVAHPEVDFPTVDPEILFRAVHTVLSEDDAIAYLAAWDTGVAPLPVAATDPVVLALAVLSEDAAAWHRAAFPAQQTEVEALRRIPTSEALETISRAPRTELHLFGPGSEAQRRTWKADY